MKTKTLFTISVLTIFVLSVFTTDLLAQKLWDKYSGNPVLIDGELGEWDNHSAYIPRVIFHDNIYKMYYTGRQNDYYQIGYATSEDGINWVKDPANPIIPLGTEGAWDRNRAANQILLINDTLHMYYTCWTPGNDNYSIGHGWSVDGVNWCLCSGPVLQKGVQGKWDDDYVQGASVIYSGNLYHMWYGGSGDGYQAEIGYATSSDGLKWTKFAENPVIKLGEAGTFYDDKVFNPYVIYDDNKFKMFFNADDGYYGRIAYAESINRIDWSIFPYPVLEAGEWNEWDQEYPHAPCVIKQNDKYKMWYGGDEWSFWRIGYAEASEVVDIPYDYGSLQEGIEAANPGEIVLVDEGIYYENIDFKGKAITIASYFILNGDTNFINNTILDGSQSKGSDTSSVVCFVSGEDVTSVLKGFTIQGGSGTPSTWYDGKSGGGIFCAQSGATIEYNKIINNNITASGHTSSGGGIFADTCSNRSIIIQNNLISGNSIVSNNSNNKYATGGGISVCNNATIKNNIIEDNAVIHYENGQVLGGGIEAVFNEVVIENNIIKNNSIRTNSDSYTPYGGGIFCQEVEDGSTISGNQIVNNEIVSYKSTGGGIGIWNNTEKITIQNNIITNNVANNGGGLGLGLSNEIRLVNNIIRDNDATNVGGGIYMRDFKNNGEFGPGSNGRTMLDAQTSDGQAKIYPVMINNTIIKNSSAKRGGGIFVSNIDNKFLAMNNIFYDNLAPSGGNEMYLGSYGYLFNNVIDPDEVEGNSWGGKDNIDIDPLISDEFGHIDLISECANAGLMYLTINGEFYVSPNTDIDGNIRPYEDTDPDIGADEIPVIYVYINEEKDPETISLHAYPNPFVNIANIEYDLQESGMVKIYFYNYLGKQVDVIIENQFTGPQKLVWNPQGFSNGIYYYKLQAGDVKASGKIVKMK